MNKKNKKDRFQLNIFLNDEENETVNTLRDKYAINISGVIKLLLKQYKEKLENSNVNPHI